MFQGNLFTQYNERVSPHIFMNFAESAVSTVIFSLSQNLFPESCGVCPTSFPAFSSAHASIERVITIRNPASRYSAVSKNKL